MEIDVKGDFSTLTEVELVNKIKKLVSEKLGSDYNVYAKAKTADQNVKWIMEEN